MGKLVKGLVKFSVAAATVGGICYVFKDKIKQSKFYQEYDVDGKIDKVKTTIKEKFPTQEINEEDIVEEDELFFDDEETAAKDRDYVSITPESGSKEDAEDSETKEDNTEVPTIEV